MQTLRVNGADRAANFGTPTGAAGTRRNESTLGLDQPPHRHPAPRHRAAGPGRLQISDALGADHPRREHRRSLCRRNPEAASGRVDHHGRCAGCPPGLDALSTWVETGPDVTVHSGRVWSVHGAQLPISSSVVSPAARTLTTAPMAPGMARFRSSSSATDVSESPKWWLVPVSSSRYRSPSRARIAARSDRLIASIGSRPERSDRYRSLRLLVRVDGFASMVRSARCRVRTAAGSGISTLHRMKCGCRDLQECAAQ